MRSIKQIFAPKNIDGLIPGIRVQRAFPSPVFQDSDPFLLLDHIGAQHVGKSYFLDGRGHDHPHRGFETLTFVFEGQLEHRDSLANRSSLRSGDVQRMNAGAGIVHGGDMGADQVTGRFHEMQLWVNNAIQDKMSTPEIANAASVGFPWVTNESTTLKVISGSLNGLKGPLTTKSSTQIGQFTSIEDGKLTFRGIEPQFNSMIYVMEGRIKINGQEVNQFQLAQLTEDCDHLSVSISANTSALFLAEQRLNEAVVIGGPFVMNSKDEIKQAQLDFIAGKFGVIT